MHAARDEKFYGTSLETGFAASVRRRATRGASLRSGREKALVKYFTKCACAVSSPNLTSEKHLFPALLMAFPRTKSNSRIRSPERGPAAQRIGEGT